MKLFNNRSILLSAWLSLLLVPIAHAQVEVNFVESGQTVSETGNWTVDIELSEPSLLEVSVPYIISSASSATLDSDYEIAEDELDGEDIIFDNQSPIVFNPGETVKRVTITGINDDVVEDDELLILQLVSDGLTVGKLGTLTEHTIRILDNDPIRADFKVHELEVGEDTDIAISVHLSAVAEQDVTIPYRIDTLTASANDIDLANSYNSSNPLIISAGSSTGTISLKVVNDSITDRNEGGADRETVQISLTGGALANGTQIDFDSEPLIVTIVDNDPITVEFSYDDSQELPFELDEYVSTSVRIILTDPEGNLTSADDDIEVPIAWGGNASYGDGDDDDLNPSFDPVTISAGQTNAAVALLINNDDNVEEDELVTLALEQPSYADGGDLLIGPRSTMSFNIIDNDPVSLSFGALFSKDDTLAREDDEYENVIYVDSAGSVVSEHVQSVTIPIYLSSQSANNTEFTLELVSEGTTATIFDPDGNEDQEWDYAITSHLLQRPGDTVDVAMRAGSQLLNLNLLLNDDDETPTIYGEAPADDVEQDEVVKFRISGINTADSHVNAGGSLEYTLTIRDLPDIDVTNVFTGLSPDPAYLENGGLRYNDLTGLFEAHYVMEPTVEFNPGDFPGYRSLKLQYRTSNYDAANPESSENDPLIQSPENPGEGQEFHFFVNPAYQVRFPSNSEQIKLIEGADPVDDAYDITTADTIEIAPYLLRPLYFPRLNDFEAEVEGAYDVNDELDWIVNFYSQGYFFFPVDRIDPAVNPDRLRVYLTAESTPVYASTGTVAPISKFVPLPDGSVFMVVDCGSTAINVQIQYLDPGDEWRVVHPEFITTGGASKIYWIDQGPPATQTHPKNLPFRLYRAIRN